MIVRTQQSEHIQYQDFIDTDYRALKEIERQSKARALETNPIMIIDLCRPLYLLTIKTMRI